MNQRTLFKRVNLWVPLPSAELRRLISIDIGEQAKRNRIARRGHRRGMPYTRWQHWFPVLKAPLKMSMTPELIHGLPMNHIVTEHEDGKVEHIYQLMYGVSINPDKNAGIIIKLAE